MRLINSTTLKFEEFRDEESRPQYAIVSHRWEEEEVTFQDMNGDDINHVSTLQDKKGYQKNVACAAQARKDGLDYFWIDTCCINKLSSAELSEAINSMFRWYRDSAICYAYLCDLPRYDPSMAQSEAESLMSTVERFRESVWFTRGWTLQELIAPRRLVFYCNDWSEFGSRDSWADVIRDITRIPNSILHGGDILDVSIAQRMCWASNRQTTRKEDMAYCLMGLFGINMPMLYGEGDQAFIRLQHEIIKSSDDPSIFSWVDKTACHSTYRGLLASSPSEFRECGNIYWTRTEAPPYDITNKGIRISLQLYPRQTALHEYIAILPGVSIHTWDRYEGVEIYLQKIGKDQYARVDPNWRGHSEKATQLLSAESTSQSNTTGHMNSISSLRSLSLREVENNLLTSIFVRQTLILDDMNLDRRRANHILVRTRNLDWDQIALTAKPSNRWHESNLTFSRAHTTTGARSSQGSDSKTTIINTEDPYLRPATFELVKKRPARTTFQNGFAINFTIDLEKSGWDKVIRPDRRTTAVLEGGMLVFSRSRSLVQVQGKTQQDPQGCWCRLATLTGEYDFAVTVTAQMRFDRAIRRKYLELLLDFSDV